jgi:O-antigen ligase/polysaccharide polymerase Wzy-like membrane protein
VSVHAAGTDRLPARFVPAGGGRAAARALARVSATVWAALAVAVLLCLVTFVASGGLSVESATPVEMGLTLLGGATVAAVVVAYRPGTRMYGAWPVAMMLALTALTAVSVSWSVSPDTSWQQASLTLAYAAVFAAAATLVHGAPQRWSALLGGVIVSAAIVCAYALATRVFPAQLNPTEVYSRLRAPYGYWNSIGLTAALAVPACLWLGARRDGHGALNALAYPALGLSLVTLLLAYSRGALLALAIGLILWFTAVPLRLRSALVLLTGGAGALVVVVWDFSQKSLTTDHQPLVLQSSAGHQLGVMVVAMVLGLLVAGLAIGFSTSARRVGEHRRRQLATALLVALALVPVGLIGVLGASHRGLIGSTTHAVNSLTDVNAKVPPNSPGRLTAVGSVRARYWDEALSVFQAHPLVGVGAGGYATSRLRYARETLNVQHAHGYVVQTLADLGVVGLAVSLALLAVWLAAAARSTQPWGVTWVVGRGWRRRLERRPQPMTAERVGLLTMLTIVVVFGAHSLVDWTWFVPGNAIVALLCAGWLAGRGSGMLTASPGRLVPAPSAAAGGLRARLARLRPPPLAVLGSARIWALATIVAVTLVGAWAQWQPLRAVSADRAAGKALDRGDVAGALVRARAAVNRDPLSIDRLFYLANVQVRGGDQTGARASCQRAIALQPANPAAWLALAAFNSAADPAQALGDLRPALFLNPRSAAAQDLFVSLERRLQTPGAATPALATPTCVPPDAGSSPAPGG